jgi:hypothetical protein
LFGNGFSSVVSTDIDGPSYSPFLRFCTIFLRERARAEFFNAKSKLRDSN